MPVGCGVPSRTLARRSPTTCLFAHTRRAHRGTPAHHFPTAHHTHFPPQPVPPACHSPFIQTHYWAWHWEGGCGTPVCKNAPATGTSLPALHCYCVQNLLSLLRLTIPVPQPSAPFFPASLLVEQGGITAGGGRDHHTHYPTSAISCYLHGGIITDWTTYHACAPPTAFCPRCTARMAPHCPLHRTPHTCAYRCSLRMPHRHHPGTTFPVPICPLQRHHWAATACFNLNQHGQYQVLSSSPA